MEIPILAELCIIFLLALIVVLVSHRIKLPPVVGFFITGVLAGPDVLGIIGDHEDIERVAELGVVLLLFTVGLEFSLHTLLSMRRLVAIGGLIQVIGTAMITFLLTRAFGLGDREALLCGFLLSLSSTAVVLKLLQERGEVDSLHGRIAFALLLAQDLAVIPLSLAVPLLAHPEASALEPALSRLAHGMIVLVASVCIASWVVPRLLHLVARTRRREVFLMTLVVICFSVGFIAQKAGLSLALGALLAGLLISESEFSHQALSNVLPFQQIFTTVFFVSIGLLLDLSHIAAHWQLIAGLAVLVVILKSVVVLASSLVLGFSVRVGILAGLAVAQVGEFSFVIARGAVTEGLLREEYYQTFLAVSVLTIGSTPFLIALAPRFAALIERLPWPNSLLNGRFRGRFGDEDSLLEGHLIIVGFGVCGRRIAEAADQRGIRYVALEMNPDTVKREQSHGKPLRFGDATQEQVLRAEGIMNANTVAIAIPDPGAVQAITATVRSINPKVRIVTRARYCTEEKELRDLGASAVVVDELEAASALSREVLGSFTESASNEPAASRSEPVAVPSPPDA